MAGRVLAVKMSFFFNAQKIRAGQPMIIKVENLDNTARGKIVFYEV